MLLTCVEPLELLHSDFFVVVVAKFKFRNTVLWIIFQILMNAEQVQCYQTNTWEGGEAGISD